ncbi:MAG: hypothetical protein ACRYG4_12045 [Janthinobacterium lividum]
MPSPPIFMPGMSCINPPWAPVAVGVVTGISMPGSACGVAGGAASDGAGMVIPGIVSPFFIGAICACAAADTNTAALAINTVELFIRPSHPASGSLSIYDQGVYCRW